MIRRHGTLVLGSALLLVALALAVLGQAVLDLPASEQHHLVALEAGRPPQAAGLRERVAAGFVGASRDTAFESAVAEYRNAIRRSQSVDPDIAAELRRRQAAIVKLEHAIPRLGNPGERSQAEVMLGAVVALAAGNGEGTLGNGQGIGGDLLLARALQSFRDAVRADSTNENAKFDLELLLAHQVRLPPRRGKGDSKQHKQPRAKKQRAKNDPSQAKGANLYGTGTGY
jgi:hypothetical protein